MPRSPGCVVLQRTQRQEEHTSQGQALLPGGAAPDSLRSGALNRTSHAVSLLGEGKAAVAVVAGGEKFPLSVDWISHSRN